ncbi:MAG TPA: hypothetical protein VNO70_18715 [Blastocatellia bacterium]|nr:hypothetical protein [Blastocatellia bacterium]
MVRGIFYGLALLLVAPLSAYAQTESVNTPQGSGVDGILAAAHRHLSAGETCLASGDMECARRHFDRAVDSILEQGIDVRADERLLRGWRELIEKISRYEMAAEGGGLARLKLQEYEGRPDADRPEPEKTVAVNGPLAPADFQRSFDELQKRFREKYKRDIIITGADHGEHRRLYGKGSAYDIRTRDLSREQVRFIIAMGVKLGLRIKDFSTWERVEAHNARTLQLGRPLDTLATGLHLHIDRMGPPQRAKKRR